jgi:hypothetical protein
MCFLLPPQGLRMGAGQTPVQAYWKELLKYIQVHTYNAVRGRLGMWSFHPMHWTCCRRKASYFEFGCDLQLVHRT